MAAAAAVALGAAAVEASAAVGVVVALWAVVVAASAAAAAVFWGETKHDLSKNYIRNLKSDKFIPFLVFFIIVFSQNMLV